MIVNFDEESYLEVNADVKKAIEKGDFPDVKYI